MSAGGAVEKGGRVRWERRHDGRYYEAVVQRDFFGGWELWLYRSQSAADAGAGALRHRAQPLGRGRLVRQHFLHRPGDRVDRRRDELALMGLIIREGLRLAGRVRVVPTPTPTPSPN